MSTASSSVPRTADCDHVFLLCAVPMPSATERYKLGTPVSFGRARCGASHCCFKGQYYVFLQGLHYTQHQRYQVFVRHSMSAACFSICGASFLLYEPPYWAWCQCKTKRTAPLCLSSAMARVLCQDFRWRPT